MRIGLYGGSFDPVHNGHLLVARAAVEELALDRLVFIPAAQSPFKPGTVPAPAAARVRMLRSALAGEPRCRVDELELRRGGISYTVETVRHFAQTHPEATLSWLVGADHVPTLPQWREAGALAEMVEFIVIPRPGEPAASLPSPWRLTQLRGWPLRVSSSEIRARVAQGLSVSQLVPARAAEIILGEGLYQLGPKP
jgi:nicotinate-nucleotide adenylyltransferase